MVESKKSKTEKLKEEEKVTEKKQSHLHLN